MTWNAASIRDLRLRMGLSRKLFALVLDVDPATLSRWERGLNRPQRWRRRQLELHRVNLQDQHLVRVMDALQHNEGTDGPAGSSGPGIA